MNRLAIYVYWDREGVIRDFAIDTIQKYSEFFNRVVVVVNGELTQESLDRLSKFPIDIHVRANVGYDFGAYKAGLNFVGWDALKTFDQVVLSNSSVYGPIFPINEMFSKMEKRDIDFWGVTQWYQHPPWPDHLQSYFLVFQKALLISNEFRKYWEMLPVFRDANAAILQGETQLTKHFYQLGFKYDSFVNVELFKGRYPEPNYLYGHELLRLRVPFLKRKIFSGRDQIRNSLMFTSGDQGVRALEVLQEETNYDIHFIYDDLLHTAFCSVIRERIGLTHILPTKVQQAKDSHRNKKIALLFYVYFEDLIDQCCNYIKSMPDTSTVVIVSPKEDILAKYRLRKLEEHYQVQYRLHTNRGRGEAAMLVTCRDLFDNFDYICCVHDKKMAHFGVRLLGESMMRHNLEAVLSSKNYVQNVLHLFETHQRLGVLMPAEPVFIEQYASLLTDPWGCNKKTSIELIQKLDLHVAWDHDNYFPVGGMYWIRKEAAKGLLSKDWKLEDFPEEPMATDGTINHALERLTPMLAQEEGYFSAVIIPDTVAGSYYNALEFRLKEIVTSMRGITADGFETITFLEFKRVSKLFFKRKIKEYLAKIGLLNIARTIWRKIPR